MRFHMLQVIITEMEDSVKPNNDRIWAQSSRYPACSFSPACVRCRGELTGKATEGFKIDFLRPRFFADLRRFEA